MYSCIRSYLYRENINLFNIKILIDRQKVTGVEKLPKIIQLKA